MPRTFTPASSAALDEMALTQIFTTISRRRYQAVGIIASNPFDTVFLGPGASSPVLPQPANLHHAGRSVIRQAAERH